MQNPARISSRVQKIEDRKNRNQAIVFVLLTVGFILLLIFIGFPLFIKAAIFIGDLRSSSSKIEASDKTPPIPPRFLDAFEATNSAKIKLVGYAEPGSTVALTANDKAAQETVAETDGTFQFKDIELDRGKNRLHATSKDAAGNQSQISEILEIDYDSKAPDLEIETPKDGQEFAEEEREIVVSGKSEPDINVRVNEYVVVVDTEGNFVKKLLLLEGENEITVKATDRAGNVTTKSVRVKYRP